jgi:hypothetical protein
MDKGTSEKVGTPLFSRDERRNVVRSFIEAYMRGGVVVEYRATESERKDSEETVRAKAYFHNCMSIVVGVVKATQAEVENRIEFLFSMILAYRMGDRITGEFLQVTDLQSKLNSLEGRVTDIERLLEELQNLIRIRGQSQ